MIEARSLDIRPVELEATQELAQKVGCSTLLAHLLRGREQVDPQLLEHYFKPFREDLYPPELYPGVPQAVELLEGALAPANEKVSAQLEFRQIAQKRI